MFHCLIYLFCLKPLHILRLSTQITRLQVVTTVDRIISIIEGDPIGNPLMSNLQTQFDENIKAPMPEYMRDLARASISDKVVPTLKRFNEMLRSSLR